MLSSVAGNNVSIGQWVQDCAFCFCHTFVTIRLYCVVSYQYSVEINLINKKINNTVFKIIQNLDRKTKGMQIYILLKHESKYMLYFK